MSREQMRKLLSEPTEEDRLRRRLADWQYVAQVQTDKADHLYRVLEDYRGCADKEYHRWLEQRDEALAVYDGVMRCQGCEDAPAGQHTGPHDWEAT